MRDDAQPNVDANSSDELFPEITRLLNTARDAGGRFSGQDLIEKIHSQFASPGLMRELISSLIPSRIDEREMLGWVQGSALVPTPIKLADPRNQYHSSAASNLASALREQQRTTEKVVRLELELQEAKATQSAAKAKTHSAEEQLRVLGLFSLLCAISEQTSAVFCLGPAWTIMRVLSAHLQTDGTLEEELDETTRNWLDQHRQFRPRMANQLLDWLDLHVGDERLEAKLFMVLFSTVREFHDKRQEEIDAKRGRGEKLSSLEKRVRRPRDEMHREVRADAPIADAPDVLAGLRGREV